MRAFLAIAKLSFLSAMRSLVFQSLLVLLTVCVVLLPLTLEGDGTAIGHMKVSLEYSLGAISMILMLSTIWLSCFTMCGDIEGYQAHMLFVKPVRRVVVWLGKLTGIVFLHAILLFLSAGLVYGLIINRLSDKTFPKDEMERLKQEVLVGRRIHYVKSLPSVSEKSLDEIIRQKSKEELENRRRIAMEKGGRLTAAQEAKMYQNLYFQTLGGLGEVQPGRDIFFSFKGLDTKVKEPLFLRYRVFVGKFATNEKFKTEGMWGVRVKVPENTGAADASGQKDGGSAGAAAKQPGGEGKYVFAPLSQFPEKIMTGYYYEMPLPPEVVSPEGEVVLAFKSLDAENHSVFFQLAESPSLMVRKSGFLDNYLRAVFVILLRIILVAGVSCAAGGVFSMPIAVFLVVSYLFFGGISDFLVTGEVEMAELDELEETQAAFTTSLDTKISRYVSHALLTVIPAPQKFEVSDLVSSGQLVEVSLMWRIILQYLLFRGMPVCLLGIWIYTVREVGLVIRK